MTEVLHSPSSSSSSLQTRNDNALFQYVNQESEESGERVSRVTDCQEDDVEDDELNTTATEEKRDLSAMEIGWPTNVRHVAHVTFDRFNGLLGLPVEFEPEVPRRAPSASATVFGVSTESMQLSHDFRGNSIPTILLLMQHRLYSQGGLQLALLRLLHLTEAALLDWAVNLMADVVQQEYFNKMNAHNIAMMADPLTALMYAVQVMNFLKTLVTKTLREREDSVVGPSASPPQSPPDENGRHGPPPSLRHCRDGSEERDPAVDSSGSDSVLLDNVSDDDHLSYSTSTEESYETGFCETPVVVVEKSKGIVNLSSINALMERMETWR
ncbi:hypothetical protein L2E82_34666 [Cichorium intybus]|uniref:Uncharacterized protein n=1 Tax=Cichorium intybus TaxID=13427 RepID=A0ACB9BMG4_CICIN|nr:hypothetical protein L2E82_34666 [Cichorium intybus]